MEVKIKGTFEGQEVEISIPVHIKFEDEGVLQSGTSEIGKFYPVNLVNSDREMMNVNDFYFFICQDLTRKSRETPEDCMAFYTLRDAERSFKEYTKQLGYGPETGWRIAVVHKGRIVLDTGESYWN